MPLIPPSAPGAAQKDFKPRLLWASLGLLAAFFLLLGRLYYLQILRGDEYREKAEENYVKEIRTPADRGLFLDRNGTVLVDSRPSYDITLTPAFCRKACDEVLGRIASLVQMAPDEEERARAAIEVAFRDPKKLEVNRPVIVKVDVGRDELDRFLVAQMDLPGADVLPVPHRHYRYAAMGGHLLGYMNEVGPADLLEQKRRIDEQKKRVESTGQMEAPEEPYQLGDYLGRRGLERRYESILRGADGRERVPVDAKGRRKAEADSLIPEDQRVVPSVPGKNLVLSLDWRLQEYAEKTFPATAGVVLALDAKTGFLLALLDRPAPDPNKMSGRITPAELAAIRSDPLQPELFRAIQQHYHPGSTFKAVTTIAALEEGVYKPDTSIFCPGHFSMGKARWRCDKESGHGWVDFEHALGASCDVFYYEAGARLGADAIAKWARRCGLGTPTGFDVSGEIPGVIPDVAWHDAHIPGGYQRGMAVNLAIGQGDVNVTPMQQLVLYAALATGKVWRPQVVARIEEPDGTVIKAFAPDQRGTLDIKPSTRDTIRKGLLAALNQPFGTAYGSRPKEFTAAGKTGTAQVVKLGAHRAKADQVPYFERDHAWFAAFAPAEDPEIVVVVLNEHSGFGSTNAAPTAMGLIKKYMELKAQDASGGAKTASAAEAAEAAGPVRPVPASAKLPAAPAAAPPAAEPRPPRARPKPAPPPPAPPESAPAAPVPEPAVPEPVPAAPPEEEPPAPAAPTPTSIVPPLGARGRPSGGVRGA
ncbi:MAG TPA: penicillin-binding protein 2 [Anaeromyxobacter sp.]|nr:penicillin-binding protein 2 [Anaeromyxobacter sp.]